MPFNDTATSLARQFGHDVNLSGTVIMTGDDPREGRSVALTETQIADIRRRLRSQLPGR
jgi:hypothetical protein